MRAIFSLRKGLIKGFTLIELLVVIAIIAILAGIASVVLGLFTSLELNTSSGPSIVVVSLALFILSLIPLEIRGQLQK